MSKTPSTIAHSRKPRARAAQRRRGTSAVEFALVAPIFLLLVIGIVEVGRLVMVQQMLTTASREGARLAILEATEDVAVVDKAVGEFLVQGSVTGATVATVPTSLGSALPGDQVTVTVSIDFADVSWMPTPWFFGQTVLTASTMMRREGLR